MEKEEELFKSIFTMGKTKYIDNKGNIRWVSELWIKDKRLYNQFKNLQGKTFEVSENVNMNLPYSEVKSIYCDVIVDYILEHKEIDYDAIRKIAEKEIKKEVISNYQYKEPTNNKHGKNLNYLIVAEARPAIWDNSNIYDPELVTQSKYDKYQYKKWLESDNAGYSREYQYFKQIDFNLIFKNSPQQKLISKLLQRGYTQKQIADILQTSEANISQQIKKTKQKIEKVYGKVPKNTLSLTFKKILNILPEMKYILLHSNGVDYKKELKELVYTYFNYKPEKMDYEKLQANKWETKASIIDLMAKDMIIYHKKQNKHDVTMRKSFFDCILGDCNINNEDARQLYLQIFCTFNNYAKRLQKNKYRIQNNMPKQANIG